METEYVGIYSWRDFIYMIEKNRDATVEWQVPPYHEIWIRTTKDTAGKVYLEQSDQKLFNEIHHLAKFMFHMGFLAGMLKTQGKLVNVNDASNEVRVHHDSKPSR